MLLIHGARAALPGLSKQATSLGEWLRALLSRAHRNVVIVALAAKLARIAWASLRRGVSFERGWDRPSRPETKGSAATPEREPQPGEVGERRLMAGRVEHPRPWKPGSKNGASTPGLL